MRLPFDNRELTSPDNNATYNYVSILSGLYQIHSLFDDTPDEDDYLDHAYNCMEKIGNVHIDLYSFSGTTDDRGELCLPTVARKIEYVTNGTHDWKTRSHLVETSQLHPPGSLMAYKFLGDKIRVDYPKRDILVAYWSEKVGEDGHVLITPKEASACAYWWKWVDTRRKFYRGNQLAASTLQQAVFDKNKAINQAKAPDYLSQNFMNQLGDIYNSRDRKLYNRSFKPVSVA